MQFYSFGAGYNIASIANYFIILQIEFLLLKSTFLMFQRKRFFRIGKSCISLRLDMKCLRILKGILENRTVFSSIIFGKFENEILEIEN